MRRYLHATGAVRGTRRAGAAGAVIAALAVLPLAAWTGPNAPAAPVERGITGPISSAVHGKCLDQHTDHSGKGQVAGIAHCTGESAQHWAMPGDNTIRIQGKCLQASSQANGAGIVLATCDGSDAQFWEVSGVVRVPGDEFINPWSGKCLEDPGESTVDGTQVQLNTCSRSAAQTWYPPGQAR